MTRDETYAAVLAALEHRLDADSLRKIWATAFDPDYAVLDVVSACRIPVVLMTNNGPILEDCLDHERADVAGPFARVFLSWRLEARKPSPEAFERVLGALQQRADEVLLVDDDELNCLAARSVGWQSLHFVRSSRLREALVGLV